MPEASLFWEAFFVLISDIPNRAISGIAVRFQGFSADLWSDEPKMAYLVGIKPVESIY